MRLVTGYDREVAEWVGSKLPHVGNGDSFGPCVAIGLLNNEGTDLLAGFVFNNYIEKYRSMEISMAATSPRWASRRVLSSVLAYPFIQHNCVRVTTVTPRKNKRALAANRKIGFKVEGVVRRGFGSQDAVICGLLAKEWRESRFNLNRVRMAEAA